MSRHIYLGKPQLSSLLPLIGKHPVEVGRKVEKLPNALFFLLLLMYQKIFHKMFFLLLISVELLKLLLFVRKNRINARIRRHFDARKFDARQFELIIV